LGHRLSFDSLDKRRKESTGPWLSGVLAEAGVGDAEWIASVDYRPPMGHVSLRLEGDIPDSHLERLNSAPSIESVKRHGPFINLWVSAQSAALETERDKPLVGYRVAVEHTSITPCYPINLATSRSTVVGEQLRRCLSLLGADVGAHFWLEENARQTQVISVGQCVRSLSSHGKADHVVGSIFRSGLGESFHSSRRLFSGAHQSARGAFGKRGRPYLKKDVREVAIAYLESMRYLGVREIQFDLEREVLSSTAWPALIDRLSREKDFPGSVDGVLSVSTSRPRYLVRSLIYYSFLLAKYELVLSVVPLRQYPTLSVASTFAQRVNDRTAQLRLLYYGDVTVDGERDSIRQGRFHSIDDLQKNDPSRLERLRLSFLSRRIGSCIDIGGTLDAPVSNVRGRVAKAAPDIACAILLDEFKGCALQFVLTGNYSSVLRWTADARLLLSGSKERQTVKSAELARVVTILG